MHFYTEHTKFGEETGRFSDGGENSFLVTSLFCLSEDAKAFACQKGQIIVVPNAESNALVNVILKPIDNLDIRFRNVAYYVYRGIRKDSYHLRRHDARIHLARHRRQKSIQRAPQRLAVA